MSSDRKEIADKANDEFGNRVPSADRRRALLKGLSKGAALAGAVAPIQALAGGRMRLKKDSTNVYYHCSVSGNMSVMRSVSTGTVPQCGGQRPTTYVCRSSDGGDLNSASSACWPGWPTVGTQAGCYGRNNVAYNPTAKFKTVFGWGSDTKSIGKSIHEDPSSEVAHWVTAIINATKYATSYPYSPTEIIDMSQPSYAQRTAALQLFKDWLNKPAITG